MIGLPSFLYPAVVKRIIPTEAMVERRNQILGMCFGMQSLRYFLEEKNLQECGLLGKDESTDDWLIPKFVNWRSVHMPRRFLSPLERPQVVGSSVKPPKRSQVEDEGVLMRMLSMYSPTLLNTTSHQQVYFPRTPDHNFYIWANPDPIVHSFEEGLKSWKTMHSSYECVEMSLDLYGLNEFVDLSHIDPRI